MKTLIQNLNFAILVDASDTVLRNASMVIHDDLIADIGPAAAVLGRHATTSFDAVIDGSMRGVTPGFIDSHVHLSETLSRAVFPDNLTTRAWVFHWAKPFYAHVTEEDEYWGALLGITEMLRGGTTCFLDMGSQYDPGIAIRAMDKTGIRGITGRHAADVQPEELPRGWDADMVAHHFFPDSDTALHSLEASVLKYNGSLNGRARCWVNIEGKEPCSLELHVGARALAEKLGVGTTYHLATSIEEANVSQRKFGRWPITRVHEAGGLGDNLVIAHGSAVSDEEVELLAANGVKVAFCPCSSLKLGKGASAIGKYPEMVAAGVTVGLGTDGVAAAGNLSMMRQIQVSAGLFKDARMKSDVFTARQALRAATIDGARALLWDDEIGSLEIGKKADLVLFDLDHVEWTPFHDPLQALVFSATGASVAETWVNGQCLFKDGRVQTVDEKEIRTKARELAAAAVIRAGLNDEHVPTTTTLYD
ncbi:5-methylthioadenosine/S-adenosylhomocysteine deaminase [Nitrobacteraceae bacterium AZCC 2146]